jgi:hypothetical protein
MTHGSLNPDGGRIAVERIYVTESFSKRKRSGKERFVFNQRDLKLFIY